MKKRIALVLSMILGLSTFIGLVGCGNEPKDNRPSITIYSPPYSQENLEFTDNIVKEFNKSAGTEFRVDIKFFTGDLYNDALKVARENGNPPDIYMVSYGNLAADVRNGYTEPLDTVLSSDMIADIASNVKPLVTFDGKMHAYPWHTEPSTLFFYRKDMFDKFGVTSVPKTWDELLAAAAKIKPNLRKGQYALGLPIGLPLGWATWGMQYSATGGLAVDEDYNILVDSEGYRDLSKFFYDVYHNGYAPAQDTSTDGYVNIINSLCEDVLTMTLAGSWSISDIVSKYPHMKDKIGVAAIPTMDGNQNVTTATIGGWTFAMSKGTEKQAWVGEFLNWLLYKDQVRGAKYYEVVGYSKIPASKKIADYISTSVEMSHDWYDTVLQVANLAKPEPQFSWDITAAVMSLFETMMTTDKTYDRAIDAEIEKCVKLIDTVLIRDGLKK